MNEFGVCKIETNYDPEPSKFRTNHSANASGLDFLFQFVFVQVDFRVSIDQFAVSIDQVSEIVNAANASLERSDNAPYHTFSALSLDDPRNGAGLDASFT